jgi:hypothetical protein
MGALVYALEVYGFQDEAQQLLDGIVQRRSGHLDGRFTDNRGVFGEWPADFSEGKGSGDNLAHGLVLWLLNEHYRFTRDRRWLEGVIHRLIAACDFITRQSDTTAGSNTLGPDDTQWGLGLLPPGRSGESPAWLWWLAVNAWAYRGMQATAQSLAEIDHVEEAMIRSPVIRLLDGTYSPWQPMRSRWRGSDLGGSGSSGDSPTCLIACGVYACDSREAQWILRGVDDLASAAGRPNGANVHGNRWPHVAAYLRRGQRAHAIHAFYHHRAGRSLTTATTPADDVGQETHRQRAIDTAFLLGLRDLLILEQGETLHLLAGAPTSWFAPGKQIRLRHAPTWFGPVDLQVRSIATPRRITVTLAGPQRNPPKVIALDVPTPDPIQAVTVNGRAVSTFDAGQGRITLPGNTGRATIDVSY